MAHGVIEVTLRDEYNRPKPAPDDRLIDLRNRVVVSIKDLDGWLYDEVRAGRCPEQPWFDASALRLIGETDLGGLYDKTREPPADADRAKREHVRQCVLSMLRDVKQRLYLQLGPARLRSLHAEDPFIKQDDEGVFRLVFVVSNPDKDKAEWTKLRDVHGETREVSVTVAFDQKAEGTDQLFTYTLPTRITASTEPAGSDGPDAKNPFRFHIYSRLFAGGFVVVYAAILLLFGMLAKVPNLLRDPDGPVRANRHVFSLSRCVLAWWFFLVLGCWLFLWIVTSSLDTMSDTALLLTGIGSATALGGAIAGKVRNALSDDATPCLATTVLSAADRPVAFQRGPGALLYDLLCDDNTIGFHRFQTLVWNGVLGLVFLWKVWSDFAMPNFDSTVLGLLGISSATFIGFKMTPGSAPAEKAVITAAAQKTPAR